MARELVLTESDKVIMADLQKDLLEKNKLAKKAKEHLENFIEKRTIDIFKPRPSFPLIQRDVELAKSIIREDGPIKTSTICSRMNIALKSSHKRWIQLDTGIFFGAVGIHLKKDPEINCEKSKGIIIWSIKK